VIIVFQSVLEQSYMGSTPSTMLLLLYLKVWFLYTIVQFFI